MIVLSAGHNSKRGGATFNGVSEYDLAVLWVHRVSVYLTELGTKHYVLQSSGLKSKVQELNNKNPDLAIEIHFNACGNCGAVGSEILYCPNSIKGKSLAEGVSTYTKTVTKFRGIKEGWYKMDRPSIVDYVGDVDGDEHPDYFLRKTNCPALIVEPEFIHNLDIIKDIEETYCRNLAYALHAATLSV